MVVEKAQLLGYTACLLKCGHQHAHVKQKEGKHPYVYCPDCGGNMPARNGRQASLMTALMHAPGGSPGEPPKQDPVADPQPVEKQSPFARFWHGSETK